jgi:hypothetical protein
VRCHRSRHHGQREYAATGIHAIYLPASINARRLAIPNSHLYAVAIIHTYRDSDGNSYANSDGSCYSNAYADLPYAFTYCDPDSQSYTHGHRNLHPNTTAHADGYPFTYSYSNTDGHCNGNSDAEPNYAQCSWLPRWRETKSRPLLERSDFESCRYLPQRRTDRHDQQ